MNEKKGLLEGLGNKKLLVILKVEFIQFASNTDDSQLRNDTD